MKAYIDQHKDRFLAELFELLRIPSVSADSKFKADVFKAAELIKSRLEEVGIENVELCDTAGYPVVFGEKIIDPSLPTILVYGHYDVQPADPYELWDSPPFEPVIKNDKIYARGACDDKGQMYMHVKALETLLAHGSLPCNVKLMIEGEEEIGSDNLELFVKSNRDKLSCDVVLISDTGILSNENPSLCTGLRGLSYLEVEVTGPNRDLHSGMYGGQIANPINILCDMVSSLTDENNHITIPGFYNNVAEVSNEERAEMAKAPFTDQVFKKELGVDDVYGEKGYSTLERVSIRPTLDVNGIWGGYTGEGAKTVIASKAYAKISMRLVPNQTSEEITKLFTDHFISIAPKAVKVKVTPHHGGEPVVTPIDSIGYKAASASFVKVWGKEPIPMREGGSIPIELCLKMS